MAPMSSFRDVSLLLFGCALFASPVLNGQVTPPAPATAETHQVIALWPHTAPEASEAEGPETMAMPASLLSNVSHPTMTVYPVPEGITPNGAAIAVFPGGGYQHLAWKKEGLEPCEFFNSKGMFCVVVRYRIPWKEHFPDTYGPLEDAQQAMRILRGHAAAWKIDTHRIGVLGFSAGGHLMVTLSQHFDDPHVMSTSAAPDVDASISARPDFVILGYPAYLPAQPENRSLDPNLTPTSQTPPTFLVQAEDDKKYVDSSLVYSRALKDAGIPEEFILYPDGGHGFGMHPKGKTPENWPDLAITWLNWLKVLP